MRRLPTVLMIAMLALPDLLVGQRAVVYRIPVTGVIENGLAPFIARVIATAEAEGAAGVVLDIDTPGGRIDAAQRIVDAVRQARVPVVAWVHPRALSAGAMIALSANKVFMAPGAVLGAATPVNGEGVKGSEKIVSAMRAEFRALAEARGRNPAIAEAMVDEKLGVAGVAAPGQLVTLSTAQALSTGYAEAEHASLEAVIGAMGFAGAEVRALDPNWAEAIVGFLTNPIIAPLLLSLGVLGLIFEIKAGAFGLGGLVSLLSLGLFFGSSFIIGLAGWEEVILLGLGLIALGVEAFLLPGFGVAGLLGICFLIGAVVLAMLGASPTGGDIATALGILGASLVITASVFYAWLRHLPNSHRFSGLLLTQQTHRAEGYISAPQRDELIGRAGVTVTDLRPAGVAEVDGERIDVVSEGDFVGAGVAVTIVRAEGYRHVVRVTRAANLPA